MPDSPYLLTVLELAGFRAFLEPQQLRFGTKRCLAVFAPNGYGKSSIVDALEFMLSEEGTLERLGLRAINNKAGVAALAHNLAEEKRINPVVSARFECGNQKREASRKVVGSSRPRPAVARDIAASLAADPLIRGYALRHFVEEQTAEQRYENVARWLQLGPLVEVQRNLRALRQQAKAAAADRNALNRVDIQLKKISANALEAWAEEAVLAYANGILKPVDGALILKSLGRADPAFIRVRDEATAEARQIGLEGLRQLRRIVVGLYERTEDPNGKETHVSGLLPGFSDAVDAWVNAEETEAAERKSAADAVFEEIWRVAEPLFAVGVPVLETCPICNTPIADSAAGSIDGVRQHIASHRAELASYSEAKRRLDNAQAAVKEHCLKLTTALETLIPLLTKEHAVLQEKVASYLEAVRVWKTGAVPDAVVLEASLHEFTLALDASIRETEAKQGENTYTSVLRKLENMIELKEERERATCLIAEHEKLSTSLNEQASYISSTIREKVQVLLDTLQRPINDIYIQIQGAGAAPIRLELPSENDTNQQRLNLVIDFAANRTGVQPSGYLSDSQIHSLALALRLAAIKRFNTLAPIIALDDVVTSYDADHRRSIAALLAKEFADWQLIITTHDERFFIFLKDQLGDKHWHYKRISRLDREFGPRFLDHRVTEAMIEERWRIGELAANEMRQAEEEWLLALCRDFGVNVRIRPVERPYSYERSELAAALAGFLRDCGHTAPLVPGVNNRFLTSLQKGDIENFGSHFQDGPYGDGSIGDEQARWEEFKFFRDRFTCPKCGSMRFKRPIGMNKAVCAKDGCETLFEFAEPDSFTVEGNR